MYRNILELCVSLTLTSIVYTLIQYSRKISLQSRAYQFIVLGFVLLTVGSWLDFFNLDQVFGKIWSPLAPILYFFEVVLGYCFGVFCLGWGLYFWLPLLAKFRDETQTHLQLEKELQTERKIFQAFLKSVPGMLYVCDRQGKFLRWNHYYEETLGFTPEQMRDNYTLDTIYEKDRAAIAEKMQLIFTEGSVKGEFRVQTSDGEIRQMYGVSTKIDLHESADEAQDDAHFAGVALDVSQIKAFEQELLESKHYLEANNRFLALANYLTNQLHQSIDPQDIAIETVETLGQHYPEAFVGFYLFDPKDPAPSPLKLQADYGFSQETRHLFAQLNTENSLFGYILHYGKLKIFPIAESIDFGDPLSRQMMDIIGGTILLAIPLIFQNTHLGLITIIFREENEFPAYEISTLRALGKSISLAITNAKNFNELHHQARHDTLTQLGNRQLFHETLDQWLATASFQNQPITLMLLDLDRFKDINDTLGHQIGNDFLQQIAVRLNQILQSYQGLVCRLGGDEFAIALPMLGQERCLISDIADAIREAINKPFVVAGTVIRITSSIGIAILPEHGEDSHTLLRCADVAMYKAKQKRNTHAFYHEDIDQYTPRRLAILTSLGKASSRQQFFLHYQPKLDLKTRKVIGLEALIRWQHPTFGAISPAEFIPLAELSDAIHTLTYWVWEDAFRQQQQWKSQGISLAIALNFSACSLTDVNCFEVFTRLVQQYDVNLHDIELEITETALMQDPAHALKLLQRFADLGVQLSIDDFGTGYSSLGYLKKFPVHALKIDQSFVMDMANNEQSLVIVRSTINLAHSLGLKVIAEGVENKETLDLLSEMGCDVIQGYFISRALTADKIDKFFLEHLPMVI